jgi:hypothetical protein
MEETVGGHRLLLPNTTQVPNVVLDRWMASMTGAEIKVVLYVIRRTYGFGRTSDRISVGQMVDGIVKRDGTRLDYGTGLGRSTVIAAIDGLTREGVLLRRASRAPSGADRPAVVSLNLSYEAPLPKRGRRRQAAGKGKADGATSRGSIPQGPKTGPSPSRNRTPGVQEHDPQNRVGQYPVAQNPEASIDRGAREDARRLKPWQGLAAEVDLVPAHAVGAEADRLADQIAALLDVRRDLAGRLVQLCIERRERDMLMRAALRVAHTEPAHPWPALCTAVLNARKEEGGRL